MSEYKLIKQYPTMFGQKVGDIAKPIEGGYHVYHEGVNLNIIIPRGIVERFPEFWEKIAFITEDKVAIPMNYKITAVYDLDIRYVDFEIFDELIAVADKGLCKIFSTKDAAAEYILWHKPLLSQKEIWDCLKGTEATGLNEFAIKLKELAQQKIK